MNNRDLGIPKIYMTHLPSKEPLFRGSPASRADNSLGSITLSDTSRLKGEYLLLQHTVNNKQKNGHTNIQKQLQING